MRKFESSPGLPSSITSIKKAMIYTDGACKGNPGPGGWGCVILLDDLAPIELGDANAQTTNNQMELMAPIQAFSYLASLEMPISSIEILSDSTYVIKGITEWLQNWKRKNWISSSGSPVANQDLWRRLDTHVQAFRKQGSFITWTKVLAHSGVPGNERADTIASSLAVGGDPNH